MTQRPAGRRRWRIALPGFIASAALAITALSAPLSAQAGDDAVLSHNFDRFGNTDAMRDESAIRTLASQQAPALGGDLGSCGHGEFRGKDHFVDFGTPELGLRDAMTVMAWMRWDIEPASGKRWANVASWNSELRGDQGVFWLQHGRNNDRIDFAVKTDKGRRYAQSRNIPPIKAGEWRHVAGVYDGSHLIIYVDGVEAGRRSHSGTIATPNPEDKLQVGRWAKMWGDHRAFEGGIDEFRLYDRALAEDEIAAAMQARRACPSMADALAMPALPEVLSHWPMDERVWSALPDQVAANGSQPMPGTPMGGVNIRMDDPALVANEQGGSCGYGEFDGHAEYIDAGNSAINPGDQFTAAAWFRWDLDPNTGNRWANIVSNNSTLRGDRGQFWLQLTKQNDRAEFAIATSKGRRSVFSKTRLQRGRWYHVAGVYDGARMTMYLDGVNEHFRYHSGDVVPADPNYQLNIGRWANARQNHRAFTGGIDEVTLLDQALSPRQVRQLMQRRRDCGNATPAIAPTLWLDSHADGEAIQAGDLQLRGRVSDDGDISRLNLRIEDSELGETLNLDLQPSAEGDWEALIPAAAMAAGSSLDVTLRAEDDDSPANARELLAALEVAPEVSASWQFDERQWWDGSEGGVPADGGSGALTAMGGVHTVQNDPASVGTCGYVQFDGVDDYLDGGPIDFGLTNAVTVTAWARWDIDPASGNVWANIVTNNSDSRGDDGQFWLQHNRNNSAFEFAVRTKRGRRYLKSVTKPEQGRWYHIAGVYDGEKMRIYVDGAEERWRWHRGDFVFKDNYRFTIGRWAWRGNNHRPFHGSVDEVQVFAAALSPAEIELMASASRDCGDMSDSSAPQINIASPSTDDALPAAGFKLRGSVSDDTGVNELLLSLHDSQLGETLDSAKVEVSAGGNWQMAITPDRYSEGSELEVTLVAIDPSGNRGELVETFNGASGSQLTRAIVDRLTFGATPTLMDEVQQLGLEGFLDQQLAPENIDDSLLEARLASLNVHSVRELQRYQLLHMLYSKRHLREVMAWFWENHFNTYMFKPGNRIQYELAEHDAFRANALGNFRELLEISAKSPAMLFYLDSVRNHKGDANENYARELLELHTLGVDGGYTAADVRAGAEIFTGWRVRNHAFYFDPTWHTPGDKVILGETITGGGVDEGERVLDIVASHPSTAEYICTKLVTMLVSDNPSNGLVDDCAERFLATGDAPDQVAQLVRLIATSPEFADPDNFHAKLKSPLEVLTHLLRQFAAETDGVDLRNYMGRMGMGLFENPIPTGWSDEAADWAGPSGQQARIRSTSEMTRIPAGKEGRTSFDPLALAAERGLDDADAAARWLLSLMLGERYSMLEWDLTIDALGSDFSLDHEKADYRLRRAIFTIASFPTYQLQ